MLISTDEYLERAGAYQMCLNELIAFKDGILDRIKSYEDNRYTERVLELEVFMKPTPSVRYWWECKCLINICAIILAREDCDDKSREKCMKDVDNAHKKIKKGLYSNDMEALKKYGELKNSK